MDVHLVKVKTLYVKTSLLKKLYFYHISKKFTLKISTKGAYLGGQSDPNLLTTQFLDDPMVVNIILTEDQVHILVRNSFYAQSDIVSTTQLDATEREKQS